jgi:hypothetical protein
MGHTKMKCWKKVWGKLGGVTSVYRNQKTGEHIQIGAKQLGSEDNFRDEKYPFLVEPSGHHVRYEKWFKERKDAVAHLRKYMKENCS